MSDKVKVTVDGIEVEVAPGSNVVQAAKAAGIEIPTYCYHPGLTTVGQCRICLIEVEGVPRPMAGCATYVREGMAVLTESEMAVEARNANTEFLLANHPLDCPVCDQAGECHLQDHSFEHGVDTTHMVEDRRTFPGLESRDLGPNVVQNMNRCISCTLCIRFTEEITGGAELVMNKRGNHQFIDTFDGQSYDDPMSACVSDICPVGALTSKDFRFSTRVWDLDNTASICPGCSIGCNIDIGVYEGATKRFIPRENQAVNAWWMCDYGRDLAAGLNLHDLSSPGGRFKESPSWREAILELQRLIEAKPLVIASANLSNEELYLTKKVLQGHQGLEVIVPINIGEQRRMIDGSKDWITSSDAHPNSAGVRAFGFKTVDEQGLVDAMKAAPGVLILDNRAHPRLEAEDAASLCSGSFAVLARVSTPLLESAQLLLPTASQIESEGSWTSAKGRIQRFERGLYPTGQAKATWEILVLLGRMSGALETHKLRPSQIFALIGEEIEDYANHTWDSLAGVGSAIASTEVADVAG